MESGARGLWYVRWLNRKLIKNICLRLPLFRGVAFHYHIIQINDDECQCMSGRQELPAQVSVFPLCP